MANCARIRVFLLVLLVCGFGTKPHNELAGKFLLCNQPVGSDAPDAIEFRPDGSCIFEADETTNIVSKFQADGEGKLTIEAAAIFRSAYKFKYQLHKYTLVLSQDGKDDLYYVRPPDAPHPKFDDVLGIFGMQNEMGSSAGEITAAHTFRDHLHDLVPDDHTYYDLYIDGKCTYADGVVTYFPEHSNAPEQDKYIRDFIVKHDEKGLWVIDPFHDAIVCQTAATNLDLPPVPSGYHLATQP
jgi:hypothetical protein